MSHRPRRSAVLLIPILTNGRAGSVQTKAIGRVEIDDFARTGHGDQIPAALNGPGEIGLIQPDGARSITPTLADSLQILTSVALRGDTVYVMGAAHVIAMDPHIVLSCLNE
ncbi:hypothetical protein [Streptomyces sp. NBC_01320]|uniref:hypothetical protein n=1 Tax=Streptomyces sp. NBC_01320 TaxID=2903824 RepID=UPI002E0EBC67|nr:hypothetical protein OG395_08825 [Streptomyces sp. NBC_01320]